MGQLFLKLDQDTWQFGDFSTESKLTGVVYTDKGLTLPKNLTGFTLSLNLFKRWHRTSFLNEAASIVTAADGTWEYAVTQDNFIHPGTFLLEIELTKSNVHESTKPVEFFVKWGPA